MGAKFRDAVETLRLHITVVNPFNALDKVGVSRGACCVTEPAIAHTVVWFVKENAPAGIR